MSDWQFKVPNRRHSISQSVGSVPLSQVNLSYGVVGDKIKPTCRGWIMSNNTSRSLNIQRFGSAVAHMRASMHVTVIGHCNSHDIELSSLSSCSTSVDVLYGPGPRGS